MYHAIYVRRQLLEGVQYLHSLQVWHRDLKSANLLLKMHEGHQIVKIADLGSARSGAAAPSSPQVVLNHSESLTAEVAGIAMLPAERDRYQAACGPSAGLLTLYAPLCGF